MSPIYPIIGYISTWPHRRIVKVKVEPDEHSEYPFRVTSLERGVKIGGSFVLGEGFEAYNVVDPSFVELYPSRKKAEECELNKLHAQYLQEKRELAKQQKRVKMANKRIFEYKKFKEVQTV